MDPQKSLHSRCHNRTSHQQHQQQCPTHPNRILPHTPNSYQERPMYQLHRTPYPGNKPMEQLEIPIANQETPQFKPDKNIEDFLEHRKNNDPSPQEIEQRSNTQLKRDLRFHGDWAVTEIEISHFKRLRHQYEFKQVKGEIARRKRDFPTLTQLEIFNA